MKLSQLLCGIEYKGSPADREITAVVSDSRKVEDGCLFVCIKGASFDGHSAARIAMENGAAAVIAERPTGCSGELLVEDTRKAYARLCQNFFGNPQESLTIVAVTGTNGKTTVSTVIKQALENLGYTCGLIGTVRSEIGNVAVPAKFTTPEPWDLYSLMSRMVSAGCTHLVMEASSQALHQQRLACLTVDCAVFTNLSQDHLDYHGSMENYFAAKRILFNQAKTAAVNLDDPRGEQLAGELSIPTITFSASSDRADYTAKSIEFSASGVKFAVNGTGFIQRLRFPMPGEFSVSNAMAALAALFCLGVDRTEACSALERVSGVRGRCEVLYKGEVTVICDFAHTADALAQLLRSMRPFAPKRLVTLFGCAGDRDPLKRPAMVEAVSSYSDFIILTSDNPRTENPVAIIDSLLPLLEDQKVPFMAIPDRHEAIRWALDNLQPGDVLLLCGKGHEDYQVIDGCTIYLDEHRIVADYFKKRGERDGTAQTI